MPNGDFVLYDSQDWGTTASSLYNYFQSREGSSSTLTKFLTNMRGAGALPSNEEFVIHTIEVFLDDTGIADTDVLAWITQSYIEIYVADEVRFQAPLRLVAGHNAYGGAFNETTASDVEYIGIAGNGYDLKAPIKVAGGDNFRVVLGQGTALSAANISVCVALRGIFTTKN